MWVDRRHLPVMGLTLAAPVLALGAILLLPAGQPRPDGACPHCGEPLPEGEASMARLAERPANPPGNPPTE